MGGLQVAALRSFNQLKYLSLVQPSQRIDPELLALSQGGNQYMLIQGVGAIAVRTQSVQCGQA